MPPLQTPNWSPAGQRLHKLFFIIAGIFLIGVLWYTNDITPGLLTRDVRPLFSVAFFETKWLYAYLLAFTGIFPVLFGFIPKPDFYSQIPRLLLANLPVTLFFIGWDIYFTHQGVWGFSDTYTTGFLIQDLPWEECLFFIIIPAACTFIYWSINSVMPKEPFARWEPTISWGLIVFFFAIGIWKWGHIYTSSAALISGLLLLFHVLYVQPGYRGRFYLTYLVSCIPFLLVNGVLTGGFTDGPVVMYHPEENFGLRVGTVPVDDFGYSFAMLFSNIVLFEALGHRKLAKQK